MLCLLAICLGIYSPALENQFVNWDDDVHVVHNPYVQELNIQNIKHVFSTTVNQTYIPFTTLSFALERHFFGLNPFSFHLTNVILHSLVSMLIFLFVYMLGFSLRVSFLTSLIFAVHPAHVESVAWITERKDVLYSLFYMLALINYLRYIHLERKRFSRVIVDPLQEKNIEELSGKTSNKFYLALTVFFSVLSILAKPMALSLPLMLFVIDWFLKRKFSFRTIKEKVWVAIFIIPFAWMTFVLQMRTPELHFPESLLTWIWCLTFYIKKFFFPDFFVMFYWFPKPVSIFNFDFILAVLILALLLNLLFYFRKNKTYLFSFLFFFVSIFFLLRLDHRADAHIVADRFMYLPSLGFCLIIGSLFDHVLGVFNKKILYRGTLIIVGILCAGLLAFQTYSQSFVWYNGISLWSHQWQHQKNAASALTLNKWAEAIMRDEKFLENARKFQEKKSTRAGYESIMDVYVMLKTAISIKPDYANAYFHLAEFNRHLGITDEAVKNYLKTVRFNPQNFEAHFQLGYYYFSKSDFKKALDSFQKVGEFSPMNNKIKSRMRSLLQSGAKKSPDWFQAQLHKLLD